ncbi:O-antigen ligase family protein [Streptomyces sp. NPDC095613]|uniref:O-antigen ligase family protein n=1 Tax=Streptomyces sp. NPDC095613 TaxID=3155540 RepID=UPI003320A225
MAADSAGALLGADRPGRAVRGVARRVRTQAVRAWAGNPWAAALFHRLAPLLPVVVVIGLLVVPSTSAGNGSAGGGTPADIASALLVVHCLVRVLRERARPLTRTAALVLGLPVLGVTVAAVASHDAVAGLPGLARYLQIFVLVPGAVLLTVRDRTDFRLVAGAVAALALVQGTVGVVQYLTRTGASYMGEEIRAVGTFGPSDVMGMATVVSYGLVIAVGLALGGGQAGQADQADQAGQAGRTGRAGRAPRAWRVAALVCAGLLAVPLTLSFSRGAWIATAVAVALQFLLSGPRRAARAALVAGALGVVLVGGLGVGSKLVGERLSSIAQVTDAPDRSVSDRYVMWAAAVDIWKERPVTGVGLKGFPEYRDSHASLALSAASDTDGAGAQFRRQPLLSPHNMYLLVLSEQGLVGLMALAGGWAALLVCALRRLYEARRSRGPQGAHTARGFRGSGGADCGLVAVGLLVWQLMSFGYGDIGGPSTVLTAVALGLVAWWALTPRRSNREVVHA